MSDSASAWETVMEAYEAASRPSELLYDLMRVTYDVDARSYSQIWLRQARPSPIVAANLHGRMSTIVAACVGNDLGPVMTPKGDDQ